MTYERPEVLESRTEKLDAPCGAVFVIFSNDGVKIREIGIIKGKQGSCNNHLLRVNSLLLSKLLQADLPPEEIQNILEKQFDGNCGNGFIWKEGVAYHSCTDFIFRIILEEMISREEIKPKEKESVEAETST